ncbi:hypothetical protein AC578_6383 [Pseudocercospora eumusae]|uniref:Uncharacterized protein n=1 Tax=Pseudocercospora eumusae TaxID=321146 RepID=A0A139H0W5_9PEZI|nr:hypothetical protein AC578_6383 [Pseudocercospora eumusae]
MLSTIRHSLHLSLPSSRKRHSQAYGAEASSDACSTRTRTDLKRIASRWVDSKRASKYIDAETSKTSTLSRTSTVSHFKGRQHEQNQFPLATRSPEDLIASLDRSQSTSHGKGKQRAHYPQPTVTIPSSSQSTSHGKGKQRAHYQQPTVTIPSSSRPTASISERSTTSSIKDKPRTPRHTAPSPTESEASLRSLNKSNVKEGFRDRQWEKARRDTTISEELDHSSSTTTSTQEVRRKKKASDLRSQRIDSSTTTTRRRKNYAFPALALLADDPDAYKSWIEMSKGKGKERCPQSQCGGGKILTSPTSASWLRADLAAFS